ncbi:MAG TPA: YCF48-related protein [Chitinophagales bacterium]|nr:YCF48-related protein [Chitinophagales bacterium]
MKKLSILLFFCCTQFFASAQWTQLNSGTYFGLYDVSFVNSDTGFAVGHGHSIDFGIVLKTTDGGLTWNSVDYGFTKNVYSISFPSDQVGYICGDGFIRKTTDQGNTWTSGGGGNSFFTQVQFLNDTVGYVNDYDNTRLKKTIDGGQTWTSLPYPFASMFSFHFSSEDTAMATTGTYYSLGVSTTFDGGLTWGTVLSGGATGQFDCINHIEGQKWFTIKHDVTLHAEITNDLGLTWTDSLMDNVPAQDYLLFPTNGAVFSTPTIGWAVGTGYIVNSLDGGYSWTVSDTVPGPDSLLAVFFPSPQVGYAVGTTGLIMKYMQSGSCASNFNLVADSLIPHHYWGVSTSTGNSPLSYYWSWDDGSYDSIQYPSHIYASAGTYNICLTIEDSTGCIDNSCYNYSLQKMSSAQVENTMVYVDIVPEIPTAAQNVEPQQQLLVFPNPAQTQLFINLTSLANEAIIRVYDLRGKIITLPVTFANRQAQLNTTSLTDGFYMLQIINHETGASEVRKFVKQ